MTTIQIDLPDELAKTAEEAGLLSPEAFETMLREELRQKGLDQLLTAADRISAVNELPYMSPEEVAEEIKVMRAEKRALKSA